MNLLQCFKTLKQVHKFLLSILIVQSAINIIGVFGPELGFDALWYHLTLPKIYLLQHSIDFIPGGLLYYSAMPKLVEMLYTAALTFGNEILAKLIHFSFGILTLIAIYKISRKFFSKEFSILAVILFYSNLVVGWMSITSYIDLARAFFETMALWGFINWWETKSKKWFITSAVMLGLAISTKLLAIGSLLIFFALIIFLLLSHSGKHSASRISKPDWRFWTSQNDAMNVFRYLFVYWIICLLIPLPWFIFSYLHTGNPVFPFFTDTYQVKFNFSLINPLNLSDPISSIYTILAPVGFLLFKKMELRLKIVSLYCFLAIIIWQLTPNTGGGRFILPYLPAFSILSIWVIREIGGIRVRYIFVALVIFFSIFSIFYRFGSNLKYVPVVMDRELKSDFLRKNLNFSFGDFYDTDNYFKQNIKITDKVLLYGFHNLYYIDFPFIDSSYVTKGDKFNYIATQNSDIPTRFNDAELIYYNKITRIKLYSKGGKKWEY